MKELSKRRQIGLLAIALVTVAILLFPIYWMVMTSIVPSSLLLTEKPPLLPPLEAASLNSYADVIEGRPIMTWLGNSALSTIGAALISTVVSTLGGYSLSRFRSRGQQAMGFTLLFSRMLPGTLLIIPIFVLVSSVGLSNDLWSVVLVNVAATVPFTTWLMKGFIDSVPVEIEHAAMIDGCSRLRALWHVVTPVLLPGLAATFTYASILTWGDFLFARTLMSNPDGWTITVGIASFIGEFSIDWSGLMAVGLISTIPMVILFIFLEPLLARGMTAGSVKG